MKSPGSCGQIFYKNRSTEFMFGTGSAVGNLKGNQIKILSNSKGSVVKWQ